MGREQLYLDSPALRSLAEGFDSTAAAIDAAARIGLGGLVFDGAVAGRDFAASGEALRRALQGWAVPLARWSRASGEIAMVVRAGLVAYASAEADLSRRVG